MAQISEDERDLEPFHIFEIFNTLDFPEWALCRGQHAVPGHKCWLQSKNVVVVEKLL